jgi:hypothetical protein
MSAWTRASASVRPLLAGALYRWQEPQPNGGGASLAAITTPMINASGSTNMKRHVINLLCGSDSLLKTALQQMGYSWNADSSGVPQTSPEGDVCKRDAISKLPILAIAKLIQSFKHWVILRSFTINIGTL